MKHIERITEILNERYDRNLLTEIPEIKTGAIRYICWRLELVPSIVEVAVDMWLDRLI